MTRSLTVAIEFPHHRRLFAAALLVAACLHSVVMTPAADLTWESAPGYRWAALRVPTGTQPGFVAVPPTVSGIAFTNILTEARKLTNANLMNGSGVALGDYDGDGRCDLYLCDLGGANALYRNLGGWKFENVTTQAGVACPGQTSTGAVFADLNGDNRLDLLVTSMGGPNACFFNLGQGRFTNVTEQVGFGSKLGGTSIALADIDGNGTLDVYVANYGATSIMRTGGALSVATTADGRTVVRGRYAQRIKIIDGIMYELGEPDVLFRNDGQGRLQPVSWTDGTFLDEEGRPLTAAPWDQGLTALFRDINQDGAPDLYVCNDAFTPDRCWINDGRGRFRALSTLALRQTSYFSMGADFADIDRDGFDDLFVVDMQSRRHDLRLTQRGAMPPQPQTPGDILSRFQVRRNTLFRARGDGTFAEMANLSGVAASEWSWAPVFLDVDLDGWEDILVVNGFNHNVDDLDTKERIARMGKLSIDESRRTVLLFPPLDTPNIAFHNQRDLSFRESGRDWGFDSKQVSNGMALADLDNDGDLDVVVNCMNAPALIYRNECPAPRLAVRLRGRPPNTQGVGARIRVSGGPVRQSQEIMAGGRYVSGDDPMRVFAAGQAAQLDIEVTWRNGHHSRLTNAQPNRIYEIDEATATAPTQPPAAPHPSAPPPWFEDASDQLGHTHVEPLFDDFRRQPLLPLRLSQLGPGVAWFDLDADGRDELLIGTGRSGHLAIFRLDASGRFVRQPTTAAPAQAATDDLTTVLGWNPTPDRREILAGLAHYEQPTSNTQAVAVLRLAATGAPNTATPGLPAWDASVGALSLADIDGDGDLDLFAAGRVIPGRYPEAATSRLFLNSNGQLQPDILRTRALESLGLVTGACFADLDADGLAELIVATEWGPLRIFRNRGGTLEASSWPVRLVTDPPTSSTPATTLAELTGWWTGIATGDFDGDGKLDLVAGNWGLNDEYRPRPSAPLRLYASEPVEGVISGLIEAATDPELGAVPRRFFDELTGPMPYLRERVQSHAAFARAPLKEILGDRWPRFRELQATTLASMLFLNRGDRFEARPLPLEAQLAPVFGVAVGDANGDGHEDVFLGQNFFATRPGAPRMDGGRGLWLRGDGQGRFEPLAGEQSGVRVYGEQRGTAIGDFDADGRVDLVVTQNGAQTKLYRNRSAIPGLRVRLAGPPSNPSGVGAVVRLRFGERPGPARAVHAGSGYWSQDSAVLVLGTPEPASHIEVRWPGGPVHTSPIPTGAREIVVQTDGAVRVGR